MMLRRRREDGAAGRVPSAMRPWTRIGLGVALVLCLLALVSWQARRNTAAARVAIDAWVAGTASRLEQAAARREVLFTDCVVGDAMPLYREALQQAASLQADEELLLAMFGEAATPEQQPDAEALAALCSRWQPALATLHQATHRTQLSWPVGWSRGLEPPSLDVIAAMSLGRGAAASARAALAAGDNDAAIEALLDLLALGRDMRQMPEMVNAVAGACIGGLLAQVLGDAQLRQLDAARLRRLAAAIALQDADWPAVHDHLGCEIVWLAHVGFQKSGVSLLAWRNGFSSAAMFDEAMLQLTRSVDAAAAATALTWPAHVAELQRLRQQWRDSDNPLTKAAASDIVLIETQLRIERVRLLLLRMAVAFHAGDPVPQLPDPLGTGELRDEPTAEGRRFASAALGCPEPLERRVQR